LRGKEILVHERLGDVLREKMLTFVVHERLGDVLRGKYKTVIKNFCGMLLTV